jgi:hypothetical protein
VLSRVVAVQRFHLDLLALRQRLQLVGLEARPALAVGRRDRRALVGVLLMRSLPVAILIALSSAANAADYNYRTPLAPHEIEVYPPLPYGALAMPRPPSYFPPGPLIVLPPPRPPEAMLPRLMPPPTRMRPPGPVPRPPLDEDEL